MILKGKQFFGLLFSVLSLLFLSFVPHPLSPISCKEILESTIASVEKIQTLKFHLKCNERFNGKLISIESEIKMNASPKKAYVYLKGP